MTEYPSTPPPVDPTPVPKVVAATVAGAAATIIVVLIGVIFDAEVPAGVEGAIAVLFSFVAGYITPPRGNG
jgi:hypothetical protein